MRIKIGQKEYFSHKVTPRIFLKASELYEKVATATIQDEMQAVEEIAELISVDVFENQFTADEFLDGYSSKNIVMDLLNMLGVIRGIVAEEFAQFPQEEEQEEKNSQRSSLKPLSK